MAMNPIHGKLDLTFAVADGLIYLAREMARVVAQQMPAPKRRKRGGTLRPGPATPVWNALVQSVRPHLSRRGEKIKLGRLLGVPPQRIHEYFVTGTATPDAERTLLLIHWLAQRSAGLTPG